MVDNCQVAFLANFCKSHFSTQIDCRIFLPKEWTKDRKRCEKTKIFADQLMLKTKHERALDMIVAARKNGVRFKWVGFDSFYRDSSVYFRKHADNGEGYPKNSLK